MKTPRQRRMAIPSLSGMSAYLERVGGTVVEHAKVIDDIATEKNPGFVRRNYFDRDRLLPVEFDFHEIGVALDSNTTEALDLGGIQRSQREPFDQWHGSKVAVSG